MADREERTAGRDGEPLPLYEPPFEMDDWPAMSPTVRIEYCQLMAEYSLLSATNASSGPLKESYLELATHWLELATEIERIRRIQRS